MFNQDLVNGCESLEPYSLCLNCIAPLTPVPAGTAPVTESSHLPLLSQVFWSRADSTPLVENRTLIWGCSAEPFILNPSSTFLMGCLVKSSCCFLAMFPSGLWASQGLDMLFPIPDSTTFSGNTYGVSSHDCFKAQNLLDSDRALQLSLSPSQLRWQARSSVVQWIGIQSWESASLSLSSGSATVTSGKSLNLSETSFFSL